MEIGSIYEIDPKLLKGGPERPVETLRLSETEKYGKKHICYTASGREGIALALKSFEQNHPDAPKRCLLPAYMCDTVFFPFERAGWEMHFYHLDRKLTADIEEINRMIGQVRPGMVFIHTYYGVDTWKSARSLFDGWRERGICIMEDVTQSYYLEDAGKEADYCVGSLRKWYAVPDGGFVASDEELPGEELVPNEEFTRRRQELLTEKWEYLHGEMEPEKGQELKEDYLRKNRETESYLDAYEGVSGISEEAARILALADEKECRDRRVKNCEYLHGNLAGKRQFSPVFDRIWEENRKNEEYKDNRDKSLEAHAEGTAPLYYPVYAVDRDELQQFLSARDIYAPTLWPVGYENGDVLSPEERYIYGHILALPIDQRYGTEEMQRIVVVLDQYESLKVSDRIKAVTEGRMKEEDGHNMTHVAGIRVDANETVATGHVMRCITIAKQLIRMGSKVIFFTADEYACGMLERADMEYVCLHTKWDCMESETALLRDKLRETGCEKLLVDSYQATTKYFDELKDVCKLIYIDDCFEEVYPVDMVINYNAYYVRFPYEKAYAGKAKLLLGTAYVPLREEFGRGGTMDAAESGGVYDGCPIGEDISVLLSSGGGDLCNALPGVLSTAMQDETLGNVVFHTVVGGFNRNAEELKRLAAKYPNIHLHERVEDMAQLMGACTAAVSAAGTMLFELSAMQTPTVFFVSADNQQYDHEFFAGEDRMLYAGDIRADRNKCLENICSQLKQILGDESTREKMKQKLHKVTDGKGAQRIAEAMIRL